MSTKELHFYKVYGTMSPYKTDNNLPRSKNRKTGQLFCCSRRKPVKQQWKGRTCMEFDRDIEEQNDGLPEIKEPVETEAELEIEIDLDRKSVV